MKKYSSKMTGRIKTYIFIIFLLIANFVPQIGFFAVEDNNPTEYFINLDAQTINKGYTVEGFGQLKLSLTPGVLSGSTGVKILKLNEGMEVPWQLERISPIFQFEFLNKTAYDNSVPFYIQFAYAEKNNDYKKVFFYDKNYGTWRPLPTRDFPQEKFVRSLIHLPFARIAVFSYPKVLTSGQASWYNYKPGMYAASPDFPKGSKIRVHNQSDSKFVDVEINDYGPSRLQFPDRVIDLEKNAFLRLASTGEGVADIYIEPLYIAPDNKGRVMGISESGAEYIPSPNVESGVVYNTETRKILWAKNSTSTRPLASLTKMVAIKIFLDTKPSLNQVATYSTKDEEYNYKYCKPWESAKLNIEDGESLTIEDLIYSSLVGSANNTIETLVRLSGYERSSFIDLMNEQVRNWGASSTHFVEPTGLSPDNVSSALDYAIITKEVLENPIISKASTIAEYTFYTKNTNKKHRIKNTDQLIQQGDYNLIGSKTGYLEEAKYCLMTAVKNYNGEIIVVVTLGAPDRETSFLETEELIKYALK